MNDSSTCKLEYCDRPVTYKSEMLCVGHYHQQWAGKPFKPIGPTPQRAQGLICAFDDCQEPVRCKGLCSGHYSQHRTTGILKPLAARVRATDRDGQGRKLCSKCREWRDMSCFGNQRTTDDGLNRWCRICMAEKGKAYKETGVKRDRQFGLMPGQYDKMLEEQGGCCAICGTDDPGERSWAIDHDHSCCPARMSCGKCIRGLLCHKCNLALGLVNDDPARLVRMLDYLAGESLQAVA